MRESYSKISHECKSHRLSILPTIGTTRYDSSRYPQRVPKERKEQPEVVRTVAQNMRALFDYAERHAELRDRSTAYRLAQWLDDQEEERIKSGLPPTLTKRGRSSLYRMASGKGPVGTDALEVIAAAYGLQAWHLLVPGLDPANPPYIVVTPEERELWRDMQSLQRKLAAAARDEKTAKPQDDRDHHDQEGHAPRAPDHRAAAKGDADGAKPHRHAKARR